MSSRTPIVDPPAVRGALCRAGLLSDSAEVPRLERAWPGGRLPLVAQYRAGRCSDPAGWWTVVALGGDRPPRCLHAALARGTACVLPELDALVFRFPQDPELGGLGAICDPTFAAHRLAAVVGDTGWTGELKVRALGYRPMRRFVARYDFRGPGGGVSSWIGKTYREGRDVHARVRYDELTTGGSVDRGDLHVAAPRWIVPHWRMLVWRPAAGRTFLDLIAESCAARCARAIGRAVAGLQDSGARWESTHDAAAEARVVARWCEATRWAFEDLASPLERVQVAMEHRRRSLPGASLVPAHRDLYDKQVLVDADRLTLLDFDTACLAQPELDLANFSAHLLLRRLQGRLPSAAAEAQLRTALFDGYVDRGRTLDFRRLSYYEASALARLACVYAFRPHWPGLPEALIEGASAMLAGAAWDRRSANAF